jgi:hypothetical protein
MTTSADDDKRNRHATRQALCRRRSNASLHMHARCTRTWCALCFWRTNHNNTMRVSFYNEMIVNNIFEDYSTLLRNYRARKSQAREIGRNLQLQWAIRKISKKPADRLHLLLVGIRMMRIAGRIHKWHIHFFFFYKLYHL